MGITQEESAKLDWADMSDDDSWPELDPVCRSTKAEYTVIGAVNTIPKVDESARARMAEELAEEASLVAQRKRAAMPGRTFLLDEAASHEAKAHEWAEHQEHRNDFGVHRQSTSIREEAFIASASPCPQPLPFLGQMSYEHEQKMLLRAQAQQVILRMLESKQCINLSEIQMMMAWNRNYRGYLGSLYTFLKKNCRHLFTYDQQGQVTARPDSHERFSNLADLVSYKYEDKYYSQLVDIPDSACPQHSEECSDECDDGSDDLEDSCQSEGTACSGAKAPSNSSTAPGHTESLTPPPTPPVAALAKSVPEDSTPGSAQDIALSLMNMDW